QVGILGMHNIVKRAMVMPDDTIEVRPMMYIALSYDHRIVDGSEAVRFLVRIKEMIEDRSEEHTSELQSRFDVVCRLLLVKKDDMKGRKLTRFNRLLLNLPSSNFRHIQSLNQQ